MVARAGQGKKVALQNDKLMPEVSDPYRLQRATRLSYIINIVKPPIKDTPKENKPPNKGQAESTLVYTLYRKSPLKEDNLSTKDKTAGPESVLIKRFHCIGLVGFVCVKDCVHKPWPCSKQHLQLFFNCCL